MFSSPSASSRTSKCGTYYSLVSADLRARAADLPVAGVPDDVVVLEVAGVHRRVRAADVELGAGLCDLEPEHGVLDRALVLSGVHEGRLVDAREREEREAEQDREEVIGELIEKLEGWKEVCLICRAARGVADGGHRWRECQGWGGVGEGEEGEGEEEGEFRRLMIERGVEQVEQMARREGGEWIARHGYSRGGARGCQ